MCHKRDQIFHNHAALWLSSVPFDTSSQAHILVISGLIIFLGLLILSLAILTE